MNKEKIKSLIVKQINCSTWDSWDIAAEINELRTRNRELTLSIFVTYKSELLLESYSDELNDLIELAGELCLLQIPGLSVHIMRTTEYGGLAICNPSKIGMMPSPFM